MATIKDVAKTAHVSPATVSRYLNNHGYVSIEARERIAKAIKALNYVPNEVARSLFQKKSKSIGLLLPDISNPFFPLIAQGIEDYFYVQGYHVILGNIQENPNKIADYLRIFQQNFVSGIISAVSLSDYTIDKPLVIVDRDDCQSKYSVKADNQAGAKLIADTILQTRYQKIVLISGPTDIETATTRFAYLKKYFDQNHVSYQTMTTTSYLLQDAFKIADELFQVHPDVDTVIAANDIQAMAIIQKANQLGIAIPEKLQIIGYDDIPLSELTTPRLTTIQQPGFKMGWETAKMLHQLIKDEPIITKQLLLPIQLIDRETLRK